MNRTQTKQIHVGSVAIGGGAPVAVQSMCNTHTSDAHATIEQIARLHDAGCEIIRLAVPDQAAADALPEIVRAAPIPIVADIHFDYRLALAAAKAGVHKIRINPGNIGDDDRVKAVATSASRTMSARWPRPAGSAASPSASASMEAVWKSVCLKSMATRRRRHSSRAHRGTLTCCTGMILTTLLCR